MASVFNDTLMADVEQVQRVNQSIQQLKITFLSTTVWPWLSPAISRSRSFGHAAQ